MNTATATASTPATLTDEQRYLFDLQGFVVIPNALSASQLAELNAEFDRRCAAEVPANAISHRFYSPPNSLLSWGPAYRALIDQPTITPYLDAFIASNWRLDHDYADLYRPGAIKMGHTLHGGNVPYNECCAYHLRDGQIRAGLSVIAYNLKDVNPGDGGFGCIPGTHKANFNIPAGWSALDDDRRQACVVAVPAPAGSAIIFTEALTHGTLPWHGKQERRTVFYKYCPSSISWSSQFYRPDLLPDLTPRQREILEPPNARYGGRKLQTFA